LKEFLGCSIVNTVRSSDEIRYHYLLIGCIVFLCALPLVRNATSQSTKLPRGSLSSESFSLLITHISRFRFSHHSSSFESVAHLLSSWSSRRRKNPPPATTPRPRKRRRGGVPLLPLHGICCDRSVAAQQLEGGSAQLPTVEVFYLLYTTPNKAKEGDQKLRKAVQDLRVVHHHQACLAASPLSTSPAAALAEDGEVLEAA
jgi:hypothetical protein